MTTGPLPWLGRGQRPPSCAKFKSIGWSHQKGWTGKPLFLTAPAQSSWIGQLTIKFATVWRCTSTYWAIDFKPTSFSTSSERGYIQDPSSLCSGRLPDIRHAARMWNPSKCFILDGDKLHISLPYNSMAWPARLPYRTSRTSWVLHFQTAVHGRLKTSTLVLSSGYSPWPGYQRHQTISANPST
jgi:hypothetical protein